MTTKTIDELSVLRLSLKKVAQIYLQRVMAYATGADTGSELHTKVSIRPAVTVMDRKGVPTLTFSGDGPLYHGIPTGGECHIDIGALAAGSFQVEILAQTRDAVRDFASYFRTIYDAGQGHPALPRGEEPARNWNEAQKWVAKVPNGNLERLANAAFTTMMVKTSPVEIVYER